MENKTGKIVIETKEDKRFDVAIELAKTVNNLSEMLKNMDVSVSNIYMNGLHIETAQGETAIQIGNNVKNSTFSNSIITTNVIHKEDDESEYQDDEEDYNDEEETEDEE